MASQSISNARLYNQHITSPIFENPKDVVGWFGAMQAQYFSAAKWGIGLRTKTQTDKSIEEAFNKGKILRTHIMRPTWHFVAPQDIRWLLTLTSPRVHRFNGYYYRRSGLDKKIFQKSNEIIQKALEGTSLTRLELSKHLEKAKIPVKNLGLTYIILQAELEGIICSGPKIGKQFTYMLLSERVPKSKVMGRDESLGELVNRYFQSHGPAQIQDFVWWSGLTTTDAKRGIEIAKLQKMFVDTREYWYTKKVEIKNSESIALIPPFDEYFVAYKDRRDILDQRHKKQMNFGGGMIRGAILFNGIVIGTWKPIFEKRKIVITLFPFTKLSGIEHKGIKKAASRYGHFFSLPVTLQ